jgi:hypothetical protein
MEDLSLMILVGVMSVICGVLVIEVYRWGYEKEKRGERYGKKKK